ncbi:TBC1 domain family member 17-like [Pollicipes pollicipes]|uniref:TBC1 domain family member 17-like n=1 Tax=Pollicipes pollicipes TaxID=41117 RepID=UPI001884EB4C|nr:TBC1 domain family member 17-like [Pollicipes pollicipes]
MLSSSSSPELEGRHSPEMGEEAIKANKDEEKKKEQGTVIFSIPDVALVGSQPNSDRIVPGSLTIVDKGHGTYMVWRRTDAASPERTDDRTTSPARTDWALLEPAVGFHRHNSRTEDAVCLGRAEPAQFRPHPIEIDLSEIRSLRVTEQGTRCVIVQSDGSTTSPLRFPSRAETDAFLDTVYGVTPIQRSCRDSSLYLAVDRPPAARAGPSSLYELALPVERSFGSVLKFVRDFQQDPRTAALSGFGKLADTFLNLGLEDQRPAEDIADLLKQHSSEFEPPRLQSTQQEGFEVVTEIHLGERRPVSRERPLSHQEWDGFHDAEGRIVDADQLRERVFRGGVEPSLRPAVWPFLLDYDRAGMTTAERQQHREKRKDDYFRMKLQWASMSEEQLAQFAGLRDRRALVEKDVTRTDRSEPFFAGGANVQLLHDILVTYCMYNFDLGYVQGMSDLLSPILFVVRDEVDAFWCFVGFMDHVSSNFELTQKGMERQFSDLRALLQVYDPDFWTYLDQNESSRMSFTFRWLLVWFKREMEWADVQRLWEVLWTRRPCPNFVLLLALAVLVQQRSIIMESSLGFSAIVKHVNDLAMHIDLEASLKLAEVIYHQFREGTRVPTAVRAIIGLAPGEAATSAADSLSSQRNSTSDDERAYEKALASNFT